MAFNPSSDLNLIQKTLIEDSKILELMDLTGATNLEKSKRIIKRSQWNDIATNEKRLCIYFIPDRRTANESFVSSMIQIDIHVPASLDYKGWEIQERVKVLLHNKKINAKYAKFYGQVGELSTMQNFFCCGTRFRFFRGI